MRKKLVDYQKWLYKKLGDSAVVNTLKCEFGFPNSNQYINNINHQVNTHCQTSLYK